MTPTTEPQTQSNPRRRLLLFPAPFHGHINPMLHLATFLHAKGFSITIFHTNHPTSPNPTDHANFTFVPISDGLTHENFSANDMLEVVAVLNTNCRGPFHDRVAEIMSEKADERFSCMITDVLFPFTQDVAAHFKIPRILLRSSGAAATIAIYSLGLLGAKGYFQIQDGEAPVHELPPLRVKDLPVPSWTINSDTFLQLGRDIYNATISSSGIIYNTLEDLEGAELAKLNHDSPIPLFAIGPLYKQSVGLALGSWKQDHSSMVWLDKQAPGSVIYVSLGTIAAIDKTQFVEMAWGLANSNIHFLWVVRPGSVHGSERVELPEGFEDKTSGRGLVLKWVPQIEVLAHPAVGGFWTHCGWNSTMESVGEGVPMLCWPCFWDQKVNARYVTHVWEVGVELDSVLERGEVERAIKLLMVDEEGAEIRKKAKELKESTELAGREGGSSFTALYSLIELIRST
eukprot:TRINITY_DN80328_c0_g1_i1.p1 TRINITY_DN80328_c0_g1~~TRINITY_DN80328_c0_g1_i1.p1  ORF type:complete len:457 (-),score=75.74 TRINITY_DN80328_c0_g1_i1:61-1431(-)